MLCHAFRSSQIYSDRKNDIKFLERRCCGLLRVDPFSCKFTSDHKFIILISNNCVKSGVYHLYVWRQPRRSTIAIVRLRSDNACPTLHLRQRGRCENYRDVGSVDFDCAAKPNSSVAVAVLRQPFELVMEGPFCCFQINGIGVWDKLWGCHCSELRKIHGRALVNLVLVGCRLRKG
jgi:hypothetical protein